MPSKAAANEIFLSPFIIEAFRLTGEWDTCQASKLLLVRQPKVGRVEAGQAETRGGASRGPTEEPPYRQPRHSQRRLNEFVRASVSGRPQ